jgi:hypothetical protein
MISMKHFAPFLIFFSIVCLLVLSVCGTAAADNDPDNFLFDIDIDIYSEISSVTETLNADNIDEIELDRENLPFQLMGMFLMITGICLLVTGLRLRKK